MNKFLIGMVLAMLLVLTVGTPVFAQTTTVDPATLIQQLQAQIVQLQEQLAALTKTNSNLEQKVQALQINQQLHQGMNGEEVRKLQEVLATDPNLYSKENVTGYYGPLTTKAVAALQAHFGLDAVGNVGPHTLEKINELLDAHDVVDVGDLSKDDLGDLGENEDMTNDSADSRGKNDN